MDRFKWHGAKDPTTGDAIHDAAHAMARGLVPCNRKTGCINPIPKIGSYDERVLQFFLDCSDADLWVRVDMSGARRHLDRQAIRIEADARRITLSEHFLDKLQVLEAATREFDADRVNSAAAPEE